MHNIVLVRKLLFRSLGAASALDTVTLAHLVIMNVLIITSRFVTCRTSLSLTVSLDPGMFLVAFFLFTSYTDSTAAPSLPFMVVLIIVFLSLTLLADLSRTFAFHPQMITFMA